MNTLQRVTIKDPILNLHANNQTHLTYQVFGKPLHSAPVVLINHALTGNSQVSGPSGWWKTLVDYNKVIDLNKYTVICFDIPGNGYNAKQEDLIENYKQVNTQIIANYFWQALQVLKINKLFAIVGGSLGGGIAWEMFFQKPDTIKHLIPIASSYKASDWLIANSYVQDQILNNSKTPINDARQHAMLLYRTPLSFKEKFDNQKLENQNKYLVEDWLNYHGKALEQRFELKAYKLMNHLLKTIGQNYPNQTISQIIANSSTNILSIAVDSDYMFTAQEQEKAFLDIKDLKANYTFKQIESIHGHDAFLIEYDQLNNLLINIFK
ncbi:alpha/beta fold hydrolase [Myroides sp. LJL119]